MLATIATIAGAITAIFGILRLFNGWFSSTPAQKAEEGQAKVHDQEKHLDDSRGDVTGMDDLS